MKTINLNKGYKTIVDDSDYEMLKQYKWRSHNGQKKVYAISGGSGNYTLMHRLITNCPKGMFVDHINRDTLDNRRSNLRICTMSQNMANSVYKTKGTSKHKGVSWNTKYGKWRAVIWHKGKYISIGYFTKELDAADAYAKKSKELFGEFSRP